MSKKNFKVASWAILPKHDPKTEMCQDFLCKTCFDYYGIFDRFFYREDNSYVEPKDMPAWMEEVETNPGKTSK